MSKTTGRIVQSRKKKSKTKKIRRPRKSRKKSTRKKSTRMKGVKSNKARMKKDKNIGVLNDIMSVDKLKPLKFPSEFTLPYIRKTTKEKRYNREQAETLSRKNLHYGQLKLLLSEMEVFLLPKAKTIKYVIYAGAAPGVHISTLAKFLPHIEWFLYDPRDVFDKGLEQFDRVHTYVQYFTLNDAKKLRAQLVKSKNLKKGELMLISDIRSNAIEKAKKAKDLGAQQEIVFVDMLLQQDFYDALKPDMSLFKFRLTWDSGKTTYYKGDIYYPIYGKFATTEFRLYVDGSNAKTITYDNVRYEDQAFYFNYCIRNQTDFDRRSMHTILNLFAKKYKTTNKKLIDFIVQTLF